MGPTAIVVFAYQIFAKVRVVTCNVKNLRFFLVVPTCNDDKRNGNETDMDCGGWCAPQKKCTDYKDCHDSDDCMSGICRDNSCQGNYNNL